MVEKCDFQRDVIVHSKTGHINCCLSIKYCISFIIYLIVYVFGPPLKIILFPVHRPGQLISGEWVHFFHIFQIFLFFFQHFPYNFYTV